MLREAPKPEAVPNKTLGEVEPAGAAGEVGDDQRLQDTKHGPADAVQELGCNDERRLRDHEQQYTSTAKQRMLHLAATTALSGRISVSLHSLFPGSFARWRFANCGEHATDLILQPNAGYSAWVGTLVEPAASRWVARRTRPTKKCAAAPQRSSSTCRGAPLLHACGGTAAGAVHRTVLIPSRPSLVRITAPVWSISATHDTTYPPHSC